MILSPKGCIEFLKKKTMVLETATEVETNETPLGGARGGLTSRSAIADATTSQRTWECWEYPS